MQKRSLTDLFFYFFLGFVSINIRFGISVLSMNELNLSAPHPMAKTGTGVPVCVPLVQPIPAFLSKRAIAVATNLEDLEYIGFGS